MGVIDNITGIKVIKPRHEESVRVRFDVTFTFDKDDIDFSNNAITNSYIYC